MRVALLGNSGSGKSTLARWLAERAAVPCLDLDTVAWEPGQIAVPRDPAAAAAAVDAFCRAHPGWVVEGCYGSLVRVALRHRPRLVLLDPGAATCLAHCRARPWEPHKYPSPEAQQERLAFLLEWVAGYDGRSGELGRPDHLACLATYDGPKHHLRTPPVLEPPSSDLLGWLSGSPPGHDGS